jgi:hypothetical protein
MRVRTVPPPFQIPTAIIHVAVADDYRPIRNALRRFFEHEPGFQWAGEARNAEEAKRLVITHHVDVLILDLGMPGAGGLERPAAIASCSAAFESGRFLCVSRVSLRAEGGFPEGQQLSREALGSRPNIGDIAQRDGGADPVYASSSMSVNAGARTFGFTGGARRV